MVLPPYLDPEVRKLDFDTRAKLIYDYHIELNKIKCESQLKSKKRLQWGSPIQPNTKFKGSMFKEVEEVAHNLRCSDRIISKQNQQKSSSQTSLFDNTSSAETSLNDVFDTTEKEIDTSQKKRIISPAKVVSPPKPKSPKVDHEELKETRSATKSKISNNEIIRRSRFFSSSTPKSKRTEEMLHHSLNENDNMEKRAIEMLQFEATLRNLSDDEKENDNTEGDGHLPNEPKGITFRKRVPPPLHGRSKRTRSNLNYNVSAKRTKYNSPDRIDKVEATNVTAEEGPSTTENIPCPLCNKMFSQSEIEMHASNCCLLQVNENEEDADASEMIKCESCDNYFHFDTDYEVHVKDCLRLLKRKKSNN